MNPHVTDQLDDFVDGRLKAASAKDVELHLVTCVECASAEHQLRSLLAAARALPAAIELPPAIWTAVRARTIDAPRLRHALLWSVRYQLAAAAAILVLLSSGLTALFLRAGRPPIQAVVSEPTRGALSAAQQENDRIASQLETRLVSQRPALDTTTARVVQENLRIIDRAIAEARSALERNPENPNLSRLISTSYQRKIQILQRTLRLSAKAG
jgi:anti-sigma factor RsiW